MHQIKAFAKAWTDFCSATGDSSTLEIPANKAFLLQSTTFRGPCKSNSVNIQVKYVVCVCVSVCIKLRTIPWLLFCFLFGAWQVSGTIVAPDSKSWKQCGSQCWLSLYDVQGLSIDGSGTIDGNGRGWWNQVIYLSTFSFIRSDSWVDSSLILIIWANNSVYHYTNKRLWTIYFRGKTGAIDRR